MNLFYFSCCTAWRSLAMQASRYFAAAGLSALLLSMTAFNQGTAPARSCESLAKLSLPDTTITMAQPVPCQNSVRIETIDITGMSIQAPES